VRVRAAVERPEKPFQHFRRYSARNPDRDKADFGWPRDELNLVNAYRKLSCPETTAAHRCGHLDAVAIGYAGKRDCQRRDVDGPVTRRTALARECPGQKLLQALESLWAANSREVGGGDGGAWLDFDRGLQHFELAFDVRLQLCRANASDEAARIACAKAPSKRPISRAGFLRAFGLGDGHIGKVGSPWNAMACALVGVVLAAVALPPPPHPARAVPAPARMTKPNGFPSGLALISRVSEAGRISEGRDHARRWVRSAGESSPLALKYLRRGRNSN